LPTRSVELYQIVGNPHHEGIIMAYLRKEKLLISRCVYTAPAGGSRAAQSPQCTNGQPRGQRPAAEYRGGSDCFDPWPSRAYAELLAAIGKKPPPAKKE